MFHKDLIRDVLWLSSKKSIKAEMFHTKMLTEGDNFYIKLY